MKLRDALALDRRMQAVAPTAGGRFHALGGTDGTIFVQFTAHTAKPQLRRFASLGGMQVNVVKLYESADWSPKNPVAPLELLAKQAEGTDGTESQGPQA